MRRFVWAGLCLSAAIAALAVVSSQDRPMASVAASGTPVAAVRWQNEQEWIVAEASGAILNIAAYATGSPELAPSVRKKTGRDGDGSLAAFDVTVADRLSHSILIRDHIWAPADYLPFATAVFGAADRSRCTPVPSPLVAALLHPVGSVIQQENVRVSARLRADMTCADAHVEAALLLGSLALREASGPFTDTRGLLSRMTAHLAVADLFASGTPTIERQLATAVLLTLVGRQAHALDALAPLEGPAAGGQVRAWARTLRLRNTTDWRLTQNPAEAPLAEQLATLRATAYRLGDDGSVRLAEQMPDHPDVIDWARLLLEGYPSVGTAKRLTGVALEAELKEAATIRASFDPDLTLDSTEALVASLTIRPASGPVSAGGVWVIDRGTWAAATERHLMMVLVARETLLSTQLGLLEDARAYATEARARFSALPLFAATDVIFANDVDHRERALAAAVPFANARPELLTDWIWKCLLQKQGGIRLRAPIPDNTSWFAPYLLPGTLYDLGHRLYAGGTTLRFPSGQIERLAPLAPYAREIVFERLRSLGTTASAEARAGIIGEMDQYDLGFARDLADASRDHPDAYLARMERVGALSPNELYRVGRYLADLGRADEARQAYERWLRMNRNAVAMSNSVYWLVRHYYEQGNPERAALLADAAAEVGSFGGLLTRAELHEWRGELEEAERVFRRLAHRYDADRELLAFFLRHGRNGHEVSTLMNTFFPRGMERVGIAALPPRPAAGVTLLDPGATGERYGLRERDVIVAVDGIAVENFQQYRVARGASADPVMRLVVWRDGRYVDVETRLRHNWIVNALDTYPARGQ